MFGRCCFPAASASIRNFSALPMSLSFGSYFNRTGAVQNHLNSGSLPHIRLLTSETSSVQRHGTTILCVRKNGWVCMIGDGMVSMGSVVVKPNARKIRRILPKEKAQISTKGDEKDCDGGTVVGFAGSTADAFTLLERLEGKLEEYPGQLTRSCVELAKGWRTDKYLRRLEASLIVADPEISLELTGNGDVLESHDGILGVGSGGHFAIAAARALIKMPDLSAEEVARRSMEIASDMCIYTNKNFTIETIKAVDPPDDSESKNTVEGDTK